MNSVSNSIHVDKAVSLIRKMIDEKRCTMVFTKSSSIEIGTKYLAFDIDYDKGGINPFSCKVENVVIVCMSLCVKKQNAVTFQFQWIIQVLKFSLVMRLNVIVKRPLMTH